MGSTRKRGVPEPVSERCSTRETHVVVAVFEGGRGLGAASSFSEGLQRRSTALTDLDFNSDVF